MTFKESLQKTKLDLTKLVLIPSGGSSGFYSEFDISPKEFLKFAKEDLLSNESRSPINALTNSKRAIDCQIDEVLCRLGIDYLALPDSLHTFVRHFKFEDDISFKLKIIQCLNLAPGLIINKARSLRNKLEHSYVKPTIYEVKEAIDIADLFIRSIDGKHNNQTNEFCITDEKNHVRDFEFKLGYDIDFEPDKKILKIFESDSGKRKGQIKSTNNDPEFYGFIRLMNSIDDPIELIESFKVIVQLIDHPINEKYIGIRQY